MPREFHIKPLRQRLRQTERIGVYDEVVCATCGSAQEGGLEPSPWRLRRGLRLLHARAITRARG